MPYLLSSAADVTLASVWAFFRLHGTSGTFENVLLKCTLQINLLTDVLVSM